MFSTCGGLSLHGSAIVSLSSKNAFPYLEKIKPVGLISTVEVGPSSHPEGDHSDFSPSPEERPDNIHPVKPTLPCNPLTLIPTLDDSDGMGAPNLPSHPVHCRSTSFQTHSNQPLLLSFALQNITIQNHYSLVDRVKLALQASPQCDLQMEDLGDLGDSGLLLGSEDSSSSMEPDDDMLLSHYQKDTKLEALARRAPTKTKTRLKKGDPLPTLNLFLFFIFPFF